LVSQLPEGARESVASWAEQARTAAARRETSARQRLEDLRTRSNAVRNSREALRLLEEVRQFAAAEHEVLPDAETELADDLRSRVREFAPAQLADVLRPLDPTTREQAVKQAFELLKEDGGA
jgi:hypothetical protein